jgi:hypothetical protein
LSLANRREKDSRNAARMKALGIERTTGICAACYRMFKCESSKSRYSHICPGGKIR